MKTKDPKKTILGVLADHPEGLTIQGISKSSGMTRITATKYIHELLGGRRIHERKVGVARLFFTNERFLKSVDEDDVLKRLRKSL